MSKKLVKEFVGYTLCFLDKLIIYRKLHWLDSLTKMMFGKNLLVPDIYTKQMNGRHVFSTMVKIFKTAQNHG